jgi:hypothetical protein
MKLRWSLTSIGGTLMMLVGLTAVASGRAQTFYGCLGAGGMLNRVSEGTPPSDPTTSTLVSRNAVGQQGSPGSHGRRGLQGPQRPPAQRPQRPQGPQGPRATGPECYAALCGRPFSFTRLTSIPVVSD